MNINELFDFDSLIIRTQFDARFSRDFVTQINETRQKNIRKLLEKAKKEKFIEMKNHYPANLVKKLYKYARIPEQFCLNFSGKFFVSDTYYLMYLYYFFGEEYEDDGEGTCYPEDSAFGVYNLGVLINRKNNKRLAIGQIRQWHGISVMTNDFHYAIGFSRHREHGELDKSGVLLEKIEINSPEELIDKMLNAFNFSIDSKGQDNVYHQKYTEHW